MENNAEDLTLTGKVIRRSILGSAAIFMLEVDNHLISLYLSYLNFPHNHINRFKRGDLVTVRGSSFRSVNTHYLNVKEICHVNH